MLNLITMSIFLFLIVLTGWTLTTYFVFMDAQKSIREELQNLFNICKMFVKSLKSLIGILVSNSRSSESDKANTIENNMSNESKQLLSLVEPDQEMVAKSLEVVDDENNDRALASFSPEVIEVINAEEEKIA